MAQSDKDIASQVGQAAKKGVKAGVAVGKAAGKAATGNYVGAASDLLKDETTRVVVITLLVCALLLPILAAAAVPMTIFGALESFNRDGEYALAEEATHHDDALYDIGYDIPQYMGEGYDANETLRESYSYTLSSVIKSILRFFQNRDTGEDEIDAVLTDDLYHVGGYGDVDTSEKDYAQDAVIAYLDLILERYAKRKDQYEDMLDAIESSFRSNPYSGFYSSGCDEYRVDPSVFESPTLNRRDALLAMAIYSVQRGNNGLYNLDPKSIVGWLGAFNRNGANNDRGYMLDGRSFATKKWDGEALPQYAYEELQQQQIKYGKENVPDHSSEAFAFIPATYTVDKQNGLTVDSHIEYETRYDSDGEPYEVSIYVIQITMTAEFKSEYEMESEIIGLWEGDFYTGGVASNTNDNFGKYEWVGLDGETYHRMYEYQTMYVSDLMRFTSEYVGEGIINTSEGWSSVDYLSNGAYVSIDIASIPYTDPNNVYVQAMIDKAKSKLGARNSDFGFHTDWCAYFVSWLANDNGLRDLFYINGHAPIGSTYVYWNHFGGGSTGSRNLTNGSNKDGTCIVYRDTVLGGGEYTPQTGDLIVFSSTKVPGQTAHIGMVYSYDASTNDLFTIEGNTGSSRYTSSSVKMNNRTNGRKYGSNFNAYNIIGFIHPNYP